MKHLLTAIACCLAVAGSAQTPYNPDSDGNNLMGAEDLMSLLSLYGGEFYPSNTPAFQYCTSKTDTCSIDEDTDIVFYSDTVYLQMPVGEAYKEVKSVPLDGESRRILDYQPLTWTITDRPAIDFRTPQGFWSTTADTYSIPDPEWWP